MLRIPKKDCIGTEEFLYIGNTVINSLLNISLAGITKPDNTYFIYHPSGEMWVFEYVISGKGYIVTEDETYTIKAGDFYAIPGGTECYYYSDHKDPFEKYWINLSGTLVRRLMDTYGFNDQITVLDVDVRNLFEDIFDILKREQNNFLAAQLKLHEIIATLSSHYIVTQDSGIIEKIHDYILSNSHCDLEIDTICKNFYISRAHLSQLFKKKFGISPYKFYIKSKMEKAAHLLTTTDMPIKEIAFNLSYDDSHHFSNAFNKHYGCSPRDYRLKNKIVPTDNKD